MKTKIAQFLQARIESGTAPDETFCSEKPSDIVAALREITREELVEMADPHEGFWEFGNYIATRPDLTIRDLILLNDWWLTRDLAGFETLVGPHAFEDGPTPAEELFSEMPLEKQITHFLAIGDLKEGWQVFDAILLSKHLKLEGSAAEIRDQLVEHVEGKDAEIKSTPNLYNILIILATYAMKQSALAGVTN